MNSSTSATHRLAYLDAVRAFALILGIVFHASLSFMPIFIGWAVMDISTSPLVSVFALVSHSFRMELFFLIAGYFSHLKISSQGLTTFCKSRVMRIGIPFVLFWFILRPLLVSAWTLGAQSMRGDVDLVPAITAGWASLDDLPTGLFVGTHLWFLYYLMLITAVFLSMRYLIGHSPSVKTQLKKLMDKLVTFVSTRSIGLIIVAIPSAWVLGYMNHWGVDTPDKSLVPHLPVLLIYGGFFSFGWMLNRHSTLIEKFAQITWQKAILAVLAIMVTIGLSGYEIQVAHSYYWAIKSVFLLSYAIMMWSLVALMIGLCKRLFSKPSRKINYLADASYWLYLIHLPLVIGLQIAVAEIDIHWSIKWGMVCTLTVFIAIVLYDAIVRSTWLGRLLNGKTRAREFFATRR